MAKYKLYASIDVYEDIVELEDDLTDEEIEKQLFDYINDRLDWNFNKVEESENELD